MFGLHKYGSWGFACTLHYFMGTRLKLHYFMSKTLPDAGTVTSKPTTKNPAPPIDQPETRTQTHQRTAHEQKLNSSFCSEVVRQTGPSCRER